MSHALPLFVAYTVFGLVLVVVLAVHVRVLERRLRASAEAVEAAERTARDAFELSRSQARYRVLFDSSPLSLWEQDFSVAKRTLDEVRASGVADLRAHLIEHPALLDRLLAEVRVIDVNAATLALYGTADKRLFATGIAAHIHPDARPVLAEEFAALAGGATLFCAELPSYAAEGRIIDLEVTVAVVPGAEETLDRVLVTCVDITERKAIERRLASRGEELEVLVRRRTSELWRVNEELLQAVRAQEEFLSNVRHEMRTPLNSIIGFTGIVAQGLAGPISAEAQRQLQMANRSGRQLLSVVNSALELNEARSGEIRIAPAPIDLARFLDETCETIRPLAEEEGLDLHCEWDELPAVETDEGRLEQIVLALMSNAVKFTENGRVSLTASHAPDRVEIVVADTGPGIDPSAHERIFEAFHQLQPDRNAKHGGTGLGLAIARELTLALGGDLRVESEPGRGSRFIVTLPLKPEPLTTEPLDRAV